MTKRSWMVPAALILATLYLTACGGGASGAAGENPASNPERVLSGEVTIILQLGIFSPADVTVRQGTTVTWVNRDLAGHDLLAENGSFASGLLATGQSYAFRFETPGEYAYYCVLAGGTGGKGMSGIIHVVP